MTVTTLLAVLILAAVLAVGAPGGVAAGREQQAGAAPELSSALPAGAAAGQYWVKEYRRRWLLEKRDGRARAQTIRRLRTTLRARPSVVEAINLACAVYSVSCETLWRKAWCETGGTLNPRARNGKSGAGGTFQFIRSTWRTTPFKRFSRFSPYASALAAAWMHTQGRGGEWACQ